MGSERHNFEMAETRNATTSCRPSIIVIGVNVVLTVVILILVIMLVVNREESTSQKPQTERNLRKRFPGYFRTIEEQAEFQKLTIRSQRVINTTIDYDVCNASLSIQDAFPWCRLTPAFVGFHACCESDPKFIAPETAVDTQGINRTLAIFDGNRQYFQTETCKQITGCSFCTCETEESLYTAVYDRGPNVTDRYDVAWFQFDGCCKCINQDM